MGILSELVYATLVSVSFRPCEFKHFMLPPDTMAVCLKTSLYDEVP
jgi:hypothetical protein